MALKIVKGNIERMFDKNLTDLVRGIRNNKENEVGTVTVSCRVVNLKVVCVFFLQAKYISQCMEDIKLELRQDNISVKSNAIAKLTYVSMSRVIIWGIRYGRPATRNGYKKNINIWNSSSGVKIIRRTYHNLWKVNIIIMETVAFFLVMVKLY